MITGATTTVRHRGTMFHVQTEDSGRNNPQIISHLYHGGTILASDKTDYSDRLEAEDLVSVVRGLIEAQHGRMLGQLKKGGFDAVIQERLGQSAGMETPTPTPVSEPEPERPSPLSAAPRKQSAARAFGEGIVSQKPLDEVILEYLAEKARDRAGDRSEKSARKSRPDG